MSNILDREIKRAKSIKLIASCSFVLSAMFLLPACSEQSSGVNSDSASSNSQDQSTFDRAAIDIGDLTQGGAAITKITTPEGYKRGDKLVTYEGPGWESDKVGYRVYLDGRNAIDIFGKKTETLVLSGVGRGEDYHSMADWGMDILKVGNSLGAGGFGIFKNQKVQQIGPAKNYSAAIVKDSDKEAVLNVTHIQSENCGGDVQALYTIRAGSHLTHVDLMGPCKLPLATGLVIHPNTTPLSSTAGEGWRYKARFGPQSLVPDNLGMAIFYRSSDVKEVGQDNDDDYIVFESPLSAEYYLGAAWAQDPSGINSLASFKAWLEKTRIKLNASAP
jgi:hypothetical protein